MTPEQLSTELDTIYGDIKMPLDRTPEGLLQELDNRGQWLARSAELVAEAQYILDEARGRVAEKYLKSSATVLREMINRDTASENRLRILADRLNATLTHQMDEVRSILSFEKAHLTNLRGGGNAQHG
jgi:hypothetical protein